MTKKLTPTQRRKRRDVLTLTSVPVTTLTHIIVAIVGGVLLIAHGNLTTDFLTYTGIVEGGNGALALARAVDPTTKP